MKRECENCVWWIGWAGKTSDFGWYAPCVCDESPHRLLVTSCAHSCSKHMFEQEMQAVDLGAMRDLDYCHLDQRPSPTFTAPTPQGRLIEQEE